MQDDEVKILTRQAAGDDPKTLQALETLAGEDEDWKLLRFSDTPEARRALSRRRHDLAGSLRTVQFVYEALEDGYRFDDERGPAKLTMFRKALAVLERETGFLEQVLASDGGP